MTDPNTKKQIEYLTNRIKELEEQIEKSISFSLEKNKLIKDLNKSEERFKKLSMLAMEGILLHTKGIAEDTSLAFAKMFGYEIEELIGKNLIELLIPKEYHKLIAKKMKDIHAVPYLVEGIKKDGTLFPVEIEGRGISTLNETNAQRVAIFRDITERNLREKKLKESEEKFRLLADNAYDWEYWIDPRGHYVFISKSCEDISGYSANDFYTNKELFYSIMHPDFKNKVKTHFHAEEEMNLSKSHIEFPIYHRNGDLRWIEHNCTPVYDDEGNYLGRRGSNRDITESKKAKQALQRSENLLSATQQLAKVGGWKWNVESKSMYWTSETYRIHEMDPSEFESGSAKHMDFITKCYDEKDRPIVLSAFQKCAEKGIPFDMVLPFTSAKGKRIWIRTAAHAIKEKNKIRSVIGNIMDITEYKILEKKFLENERLFKNSEQTAHLGSWEMNIETGATKWSDEFF